MTSRRKGSATSTKAPSYADRLSECEDKGVVGLKELRDRPRLRDGKVAKLVKLFKTSKNIVVLTGAGISTSAGIADFRGPHGVWTLEKKKLKRSTSSPDTSFECALPTPTHVILAKLCEQGIITRIISQNVDGLHLRSGLPRERLIELHGNVFLERCAKCEFEVFHDTDVGGVGCLPTGKRCPKCRTGELHDTVLDWSTPIDDDELETSERLMAEADLVVCLGTSLRIVPAANLPLLSSGKLVVVNLQATPLDDKADVLIHCEVDEVMQRLADEML